MSDSESLSLDVGCGFWEFDLDVDIRFFSVIDNIHELIIWFDTNIV